MSGWFGHSRKKSPRPGLTGSGSIERPNKPPNDVVPVWLEGDAGGQGMNNPLAWDKIPSVLQEKFPHWKDSPLTTKKSSQSSDPDMDSSYSCYKSTNKQQPDCTFPYVVMDNDTLNSIAVKFETTPTELARLNKKPLGLSTAIFTGEVLYVPDHDEIARSTPKSAPPPTTPPSSSDHNHLPSSVESQGTLRSSSVSHPSMEEDEGGNDGNGDPPMPDDSPPHDVETIRDLFEEVTDTHFVLLSRYISDDQGCIHGKLMINRTVLIFTPFHDNPLVKEHGPASFEIMIPLQDIVFAAFARDVEQPQRKRISKEQLIPEEKKADNTSEEEKGKEEDEEKEKCIVMEEEKKKEKKEEEEKKEEKKEDKEEEEEVLKDETVVAEVNIKEEVVEEEAGRTREDAAGEEKMETQKDVSPATEEAELKVSSSEMDRASLNEDGSSIDSRDPHQHPPPCYHRPSQSHSASSTDELLAIMGAEPPAQNIQINSSHTNSECSADSLLSDHPCFLHLSVSHKSCASHTYIPINRPVGIDIPREKNNPFSPVRGILQQVRTTFCFAVAEHRVLQLVTFLTKHHPNTDHTPSSWTESNTGHTRAPCTWVDGIFEFINYGSIYPEDLLFSDDHFQTAESSESWEVYSLKDESKYRHKIERMEVEGILPLPVLSEPSQLMEDAHLREISNNLPSAAVSHDWILIYSTFKHGISLRTLYRNMQACNLPESPVILLVRDDQCKLFGAAISSPLHMSDKFYGTGESYLFSFESGTSFKVYNWTGQNNYIVKGSSDGIFVGCEAGHIGLWLDEYLLNGTSQSCSTFENDCLSSKEEFICTGVEAWGFM